MIYAITLSSESNFFNGNIKFKLFKNKCHKKQIDNRG